MPGERDERIAELCAEVERLSTENASLKKDLMSAGNARRAAESQMLHQANMRADIARILADITAIRVFLGA